MDYIYGPVPSRRLGFSLGIDIVPYKTCTLDCIYCQIGKTTRKTVKRKPYAPKDDILTVSRPPSEIYAEPVSHFEMLDKKNFFGEGCEVIAGFQEKRSEQKSKIDNYIIFIMDFYY